MSERTITIERLGHRGDGIAEGPIYAQGCLPGERVTGDLDGERLTNIRVLESSPARVRPPCRHAKSCGGCTFQHVRDNIVEAWKADVVERALGSHDIDVTIAATVTSPPQSRRRATVHAKRTKSGSIVGFFGRNSHNLIDTPDCMLLSQEVLNARPLLDELTRVGASRSSTISISVLVSEGGLDVSVGEAKPADRGMLTVLAELAGRYDLARLCWNGEVIAQARPAFHQMGPAQVVPPPGAFLQATKHAEAALVDLVQRATDGAAHVVDLFAGCGTFALPLTQTRSVHAVEGAPELLQAAHGAWARVGGLHKLTTEARDLFRRPLMPDELARFDAAIIDPPRAGAAAQVAELAKSAVPVIAAVSCNPVTFARDAAVLVAAGYTMGPVTIVDQFRWSHHIELFAEFRR